MLGLSPRFGKGANWLSDCLSDSPDVGPVKRWIYGAALAAIPIAYGVWRLVVGGPMTWGRLRLSGAGAGAGAAVCIALGAFLHFHFLWAPDPKYWRVGRWGKTVCVLAMIGAGGGLVVWLLVFEAWRP